MVMATTDVKDSCFHAGNAMVTPVESDAAVLKMPSYSVVGVADAAWWSLFEVALKSELRWRGNSAWLLCGANAALPWLTIVLTLFLVLACLGSVYTVLSLVSWAFSYCGHLLWRGIQRVLLLIGLLSCSPAALALPTSSSSPPAEQVEQVDSSVESVVGDSWEVGRLDYGYGGSEVAAFVNTPEQIQLQLVLCSKLEAAPYRFSVLLPHDIDSSGLIPVQLLVDGVTTNLYAELVNNALEFQVGDNFIITLPESPTLEMIFEAEDAKYLHIPERVSFSMEQAHSSLEQVAKSCTILCQQQDFSCQKSLIAGMLWPHHGFNNLMSLRDSRQIEPLIAMLHLNQGEEEANTEANAASTASSGDSNDASSGDSNGSVDIDINEGIDILDGIDVIAGTEGSNDVQEQDGAGAANGDEESASVGSSTGTELEENASTASTIYDPKASEERIAQLSKELGVSAEDVVDVDGACLQWQPQLPQQSSLQSPAPKPIQSDATALSVEPLLALVNSEQGFQQAQDYRQVNQATQPHYYAYQRDGRSHKNERAALPERRMPYFVPTTKCKQALDLVYERTGKEALSFLHQLFHQPHGDYQQYTSLWKGVIKETESWDKNQAEREIDNFDYYLMLFSLFSNTPVAQYPQSYYDILRLREDPSSFIYAIDNRYELESIKYYSVLSRRGLASRTFHRDIAEAMRKWHQFYQEFSMSLPPIAKAQALRPLLFRQMLMRIWRLAGYPETLHLRPQYSFVQGTGGKLRTNDQLEARCSIFEGNSGDQFFYASPQCVKNIASDIKRLGFLTPELQQVLHQWDTFARAWKQSSFFSSPEQKNVGEYEHAGISLSMLSLYKIYGFGDYFLLRKCLSTRDGDICAYDAYQNHEQYVSEMRKHISEFAVIANKEAYALSELNNLWDNYYQSLCSYTLGLVQKGKIPAWRAYLVQAIATTTQNEAMMQALLNAHQRVVKERNEAASATQPDNEQLELELEAEAEVEAEGDSDDTTGTEAQDEAESAREAESNSEMYKDPEQDFVEQSDMLSDLSEEERVDEEKDEEEKAAGE